MIVACLSHHPCLPAVVIFHYDEYSDWGILAVIVVVVIVIIIVIIVHLIVVSGGWAKRA